ncbi:hypothetical protein [Providencia rustigianii]|uniref:hypothetical protein n=1 Tax=Providencia rustigianii TaxID=158850 RepID=UPI00135AD382
MTGNKGQYTDTSADIPVIPEAANSFNTLGVIQSVNRRGLDTRDRAGLMAAGET